MKTIVLIPCGSTKTEYKTKAEELYISPLFIKNLAYAKSLSPDVYILSALHGLVALDTELEPYDKTLNKMTIDEVKEWSNKVIAQLKEVSDLDNDKFVFLTGVNYRKFILPHIKNYELPMEGLKIGKQLQWLTEQISILN